MKSGDTASYGVNEKGFCDLDGFFVQRRIFNLGDIGGQLFGQVFCGTAKHLRGTKYLCRHDARARDYP